MPTKNWNFQNTYAALPKIFYTHQNPTKSPTPQIVIFNDTLATELGLNSDTLRSNPNIFTGNILPQGTTPIAQAYAGYQFGHFAMLGDGRAILLGEHITPDGLKFDIQLKGSGRTPYSRGGDGLAALAPMLREYIISEAMHQLGIPTTRSLAVALTGQDVIRERILQGAILTRIASSHLRVGTFNFAAAYGAYDDLKKLADYAIDRHYSHLADADNKYLLFLREVAQKQAALIAQWQLVGFVHGVMNTDNMAISGETIDYGPCAFMDTYDPDTVFSSIDHTARYAYKNQPTIGAWNLARLAESLLPLIGINQEKAAELVRAEIANYTTHYEKYWHEGMYRKLGIAHPKPNDVELITELLSAMKVHKLDYTNTFHKLSNDESILEIDIWQQKWCKKLTKQSMEVMKAHNPAVIPRNHHVEEALKSAEDGDYAEMHNLLAALHNPYTYHPKYSKPPEEITCYRTFCGT